MASTETIRPTGAPATSTAHATTADPASIDAPASPAPSAAEGLAGAAGPSRSPRNGPRRPGRTLRIVLATLVPIALLAVWWIATATGAVPPNKLPAPGAVLDAAVDLAAKGLLQEHMAISTQRVLIGFALGSALGLAVGALVGLSRWAEALLSSTISALRAVPSLAWIPLLLIWLGIFETPKITLIAIGAFFPVFTTVAGALRHVDPHLVEAGRAFGLRGVRLLGVVQLPAVIPSIISGLRLAMAQAWLFLVAAELLNSSKGLGFLLIDSQNNGRTDRLVLAIITLAVLGKLSDALISLLGRLLLRRWS